MSDNATHRIKIGILGAGGQADEAESYLKDDQEVIFRAVSKRYLANPSSNLIDIESLDYKDTPVVVAVGAPALRKKMTEDWSGNKYLVLVSDKAFVDDGASIGKGTVVAPGVVITTNVVIGDHVLINVGSTISHNCIIGNFATISPGVHIAGSVGIGEGVFIGIGATISNNVKIAAGSVIGAGTVVLEDITIENSVVVGTPGRVIKTNKGWLSEI